ncbi:MAG TPA: YtxH domain-containing protein [Candidatus Saccharimonadales bacterium]|nr:YtxH domain-containing protein [Candidatus Saccharimonadales bacterium]
MGKSLKKFALFAGIAAAVGYLAGILTAPQSGKETREDIKDAAQKGVSQAEKQLKKTLAELSDLIEDLKKQGEKLGDRARKEMDELVEKGKMARDKAREVLSAIHEGDADDEDLKDAVTQATEALDHLKAYLRK